MPKNTWLRDLIPRHFLSLLLSSFITWSMSFWVMVKKSRLLGKYCLMRPFVFSFSPRCHRVRTYSPNSFLVITWYETNISSYWFWFLNKNQFFIIHSLSILWGQGYLKRRGFPNWAVTYLDYWINSMPGDGIEPPTRGFSILCSTDWAIRA